MKISYVFHRDAADPGVQSGRPASILSELQVQGADVHRIFPLSQGFDPIPTFKQAAHRTLGTFYRPDREPARLRRFASEIVRRTEGVDHDLLFSPGSECISQLETERPITLSADATFANLVDYYWDFRKLPREYLRKGHSQEQSALARTALAVYPSEWAANSACNYYGLARERVAVIPFGANFGVANQRPAIHDTIAQRKIEPLRLLFVGRHWERKGGSLVVETALRLQARGVKVRVDIVGCEIPPACRKHSFLVGHGSLDSRRPAGRRALEELFEQSHLLFVPSRAEAFGMVYCEANAFGLPALATATGGIPGVVRDGVNGWCLPLEAGPEDYAAILERMVGDQDAYMNLARSSFNEFETRLNWRTWTREYLKRARALVQKPAAAAGAESAPVEIHSGRKIRLGYLADSYLSPDLLSSWSGLPYYIKKCLESSGCEIVPVATATGSFLWMRWVRFIYWRLRGLRYLRDRDPAVLDSYARQLSQSLQKVDVDAVFSPGSTTIAHLDTDLPIVIWTDATFAGVLNFYESFTGLAPRSIREGHAAERAALSRCALAIYPSKWAADSARDNYPIPPERVKEVPFGSNLDSSFTRAEIEGFLRDRSRETSCRLLFIGIDWNRKRGNLAIETAKELTALGIETRLDLIGCDPPPGTELPPYVHPHGFLSKSDPAGRAKIEELFRASHFFIMQSRAECYGVVFCEAMAHGLPCVATSIGGIPSIITNDVTGRTFPLEERGRAYAEWIAGVMRTRGRYEELALAAFDEATTRLSWPVAARQMRELIEEMLAKRAGDEAGAAGETRRELAAV